MNVRELILALSEYKGDEEVFFEVAHAMGELAIGVIEKDKDGNVVLREAE